tara:strand:- start:291 stop:611 length:321 start_codon:yes stop_codon:yes gene_type:complete
MRDKITDYVEEFFPYDMDKILLADGFEEAFIGVTQSMGSMPKACYNYDKCIEILMGRPDELGIQNTVMSYEEAVEYFEFNVNQAYVGEYTPSFVTLMDWKKVYERI